MKKLLKNAIGIIMAMSVVLGTIQPMYVTANEVAHIGHEECDHASANVVIMGHNCNDYFDVYLRERKNVPVGTATTCTMDVYWYDWICTFPGCGVIDRLDYSYVYNNNHVFETSNGYTRCTVCRYSY